MSTNPRRWRLLLVLLALFGLMAAACGDDDDAGSSGDDGGTEGAAEPVEVRLGYFPNITHAPAIVGDRGGLFQEALGNLGTIEVQNFNAGPEAVQALLTGSLDLSFIGPNPAINAYAQSLAADGEGAVRIVSGTTSGGAFLVVKDGIDAPEDLEGKRIATPQLGNTQDVALRAWLKEQGLSADEAGGGDVSIQPQANGDALTAFLAGSLDGAWVPEPFATRFIQEGNAQVLVDERDLWPGGRYVTTHLIVRTEFLEEHPDVVRAVLEGLLGSLQLIGSDPVRAKTLTNEGIEAIAGKPLGQEVLDAAWENLEFTHDPIASSLQKSKDDAVAVALLEEVDLADIYDLTLLNELLEARGDDQVEGL